MFSSSNANFRVYLEGFILAFLLGLPICGHPFSIVGTPFFKFWTKKMIPIE
jgi:hypothetical protein